jgi:hypothetical protein
MTAMRESPTAFSFIVIINAPLKLDTRKLASRYNTHMTLGSNAGYSSDKFIP